MSNSRSRIPSPARSMPLTPRRRETPRKARSVCSPARSTASGRLSCIIREHREQNIGSMSLSPLTRKSVLTDNTDIGEINRQSWWKDLKDNSRDVMEVLKDNNAEPHNIFENIEILSQEEKCYTLDLPDSSDSESIQSIVIPQRKLFHEKENQPHKKFNQFGTRETLDKLHKQNTGDKTISIATKELFRTETQSRPILPAALLDISSNTSTSEKTVPVVTEKRRCVNNLFSNQKNNLQTTKRKNMFAQFIESDSEDELPEIRPKFFALPTNTDSRRPSVRRSTSRGVDTSMASSMDIDDWQLLPSSTMVDNELNTSTTVGQAAKRSKLSKLSEVETSTTSSEDPKGKHSNKSISPKCISKMHEKSPQNLSIVTRNTSKILKDVDEKINKSQNTPHQTSRPHNTSRDTSKNKSGINEINKSPNESHTSSNSSKSSRNIRNKNKSGIEEKNKSPNNSQSSPNMSQSSRNTENKNNTVIEEINKSPSKSHSSSNISQSSRDTRSRNKSDIANKSHNSSIDKPRNAINNSKNVSIFSKVQNDNENDNPVSKSIPKSSVSRNLNLDIDEEEDLENELQPDDNYELDFTLEYGDDNAVGVDETNITKDTINKPKKDANAPNDMLLKELEPKENNANIINTIDKYVQKTRNKVIEESVESVENKSHISAQKANEDVNVDENIDKKVEEKNHNNSQKPGNESEKMKINFSKETKQQNHDQVESEYQQKENTGYEIEDNQNQSQRVCNEKQKEHSKSLGESNEIQTSPDGGQKKENENQQEQNKSKKDRDESRKTQNETEDKNDSKNESKTRIENENQEQIADDRNESPEAIEDTENENQEQIGDDGNENRQENENALKNNQEHIRDNESESKEQIENDKSKNKEQIVDDKNEKQEEIEDAEKDSHDLIKDNENNSQEHIGDDVDVNENQELIEIEKNESREEIEDTENESHEQIENDENENQEEIEDYDFDNQEEIEDNDNQEQSENDKNESQEDIEDDENESQEQIEDDENENQEDIDDAENEDREKMELNESEFDQAIENDEENESIEYDNEQDESLENDSDQTNNQENDGNQTDNQENDSDKENDMDCEDANESKEAESDENDNQGNSDDDDQIENTQTPNVSHDTTGRNRKKGATPEIVLRKTRNENETTTLPNRNTSIRKTKSMIQRQSMEFFDGSKNSSDEGSGWDSHRTTRKTLRQTFGKDFSIRKSLRAMVMEKTAKARVTAVEDASIAVPHANSTEFPEPEMTINEVEMQEPPTPQEVSIRTRQATIVECLERAKRRRAEENAKVDEEVKRWLKQDNKKTRMEDPFQIPIRPLFRRPIAKPKPKANNKKSLQCLLSLENLPEEFIEDLKYKPPKRFCPRNAAWLTKRLYNYLETKLQPKYDYKARVRAEKFAHHLYDFVQGVRKRGAPPTAPQHAVDALKMEMARLSIVRTHYDFYNFFHEFMPREVRVKVIPDIVNKIPHPKTGVFSDIL